MVYGNALSDVRLVLMPKGESDKRTADGNVGAADK
jgi:hypothetical protein